MSSLLIIGAGGHGKVVAETALACGHSDIAFLDQDWPTRRENGQWPIVGKPEVRDASMFCAVGRNIERMRIFLELQLNDSPVLVHPSVVLSPTAKLGPGTVAVAGCIVNADARVGRGVILNTASTIDHDCVIEDFVHISPGAHLAGGVNVGEGTWIGIGAVVREGVRIGKNVVVAAGATVIHDVSDSTRVGGVPAREF